MILLQNFVTLQISHIDVRVTVDRMQENDERERRDVIHARRESPYSYLIYSSADLILFSSIFVIHPRCLNQCKFLYYSADYKVIFYQQYGGQYRFSSSLIGVIMPVKGSADLSSTTRRAAIESLPRVYLVGLWGYLFFFSHTLLPLTDEREYAELGDEFFTLKALLYLW